MLCLIFPADAAIGENRRGAAAGDRFQMIVKKTNGLVPVVRAMTALQLAEIPVGHNNMGKEGERRDDECQRYNDPAVNDEAVHRAYHGQYGEDAALPALAHGGGGFQIERPVHGCDIDQAGLLFLHRGGFLCTGC